MSAETALSMVRRGHQATQHAAAQAGGQACVRPPGEVGEGPQVARGVCKGPETQNSGRGCSGGLVQCSKRKCHRCGLDRAGLGRASFWGAGSHAEEPGLFRGQ